MSEIILFGVFAIIWFILAMVAFVYCESGLKVVGIIPSLLFIAFIGITIEMLIVYNSPHGGRSPTLADVPKEAYVDTLVTTSSSGVVEVKYNVRWNEDRDTVLKTDTTI